MEKLNELDDLVLLVNSKNNPFDNYSTVKDKTILAIAEAFRALEKVAQKNLEGAFAWQNRAEAAEAKLAELAKQQQQQQQQRYFYREHNSYNGMKTDWTEVSAEQLEHLKEIVDLDTAEIIEVYTRPAPAADLAELVPMEWTNEQCLEFLSIAFRHSEISGDIEMDDIRQAVNMVNAGAKNH